MVLEGVFVPDPDCVMVFEAVCEGVPVLVCVIVFDAVVDEV